MELQIYTDGACSGNPGAGGWGVVMLYNGKKKELSGYDPATTNNRMELTAIIRGLSAIKTKTPTTVITDSKYVVDAINKNWITNWQNNNWKNSQKQPVANKDLWQELLSLIALHRPKFVWVKGHADNEHNNRCDTLATEEIAKRRASTVV
jgi:ribonuclease HI